MKDIKSVLFYRIAPIIQGKFEKVIVYLRTGFVKACIFPAFAEYLIQNL